MEDTHENRGIKARAFIWGITSNSAKARTPTLGIQDSITAEDTTLAFSNVLLKNSLNQTYPKACQKSLLPAEPGKSLVTKNLSMLPSDPVTEAAIPSVPCLLPYLLR